MAELVKFVYVAMGPTGKKKKGKIDSLTRTDAIQAIMADGLIPVTVEEFRGSVGQVDIFKSKEDRPLKMKLNAVADFANRLWLQTRAGMSPAESLALLAKGAEDVRFSRMCLDLQEQINRGTKLSVAMAGYPGCFDKIFCAYVEAGEESGDLVECFARLAHMLKTQNAQKLKIKAVTAYPKMVSAVIAIAVVGIMLFLVPMYAEIYNGFGQQLPAPTRGLMWLSDQIMPIRMIWKLPAPNPTSPLVWLFGMWLGWKKFRKNTADNLELCARIDDVKFRIPVIGSLWKKEALFRWASTAAGASNSGLGIVDTLRIAGLASGSSRMQLICQEIALATVSGQSPTKLLNQYPQLFDPLIQGMLESGEVTGEQAQTYENVAFTLENEIDSMVATLGARLEVLLLVFMGVVVGSLLIVLYLPIFGLSAAASEGYSE